MKEGGSARDKAAGNNLLQENDANKLKEVILEVIKQNIGIVEEIKEGKTEAMQFLVGQIMKNTKGSANPIETQRILKEELGI